MFHAIDSHLNLSLLVESMYLTNVALQENLEPSLLQSLHQSLELYTACSLLMWVGGVVNLWSWFYYRSSIDQGWFAEHFS